MALSGNLLSVSQGGDGVSTKGRQYFYRFGNDGTLMLLSNGVIRANTQDVVGMDGSTQYVVAYYADVVGGGGGELEMTLLDASGTDVVLGGKTGSVSVATGSVSGGGDVGSGALRQMVSVNGEMVAYGVMGSGSDAEDNRVVLGRINGEGANLVLEEVARVAGPVKGAGSEDFGRSVVMRGDLLLVADRGFNDGMRLGRGAVHVYQMVSGGAVYAGSVRSGYDEVGLEFGWSVDFDAGVGLMAVTTKRLGGNVVELFKRPGVLMADSDGDGVPDEVEVGSTVYSVVTGTFTWEQARMDALSRGGHLATVASLAKWNAIKAAVPAATLGGRNMWIGGSDAGKEGFWGWVTGEPWGYTRWATFQPDNGGGLGTSENYLALMTDGSWADFGAESTMTGYLLEKGTKGSVLLADTDGDGLSDGEEDRLGTDPTKVDTDGDTLGDFA